MIRASVILALLVVTSACRSANLALTVALPAGHDHDVLRAFVFAPGPGFVVDCDAISFADVTFDQLASSLVVANTLGASAGDLGSVPREGHKIVVVEAFAPDSNAPSLFGCSDVGNLEADASVDVTLEPTAAAEVVGGVVSFTADIPHDGAGSLEPPIEVIVRTADGQLAAGHDVRVRVFRDGAVGSTVAPFTPSGGNDAMIVPFRIGQTGTFTVEVRARAQLGTPQPPIAGLALPADDAVEPFASLSSPPSVVVAGPMGDGFPRAAFVGAGGPLRVAVVDNDGSTGDAPAFTVTAPLPTSAESAVAIPAFAFDETNGYVAVAALADGTLALVSATKLVASSSPLIGICGVAPLGDCNVDSLALPLLVSKQDAAGNCTAFAKADVDGAGNLGFDTASVTTSAVNQLGVRFSLCAQDSSNVLTRFLIAVDASPGSQPELIAGLDGGHVSAPDLAAVFAVSSAGRLTGESDATVARFAGSGVAVGTARLALAQPSLLLEQIAFELPAPPSTFTAFASGARTFALMTPSPAQPTIFAMYDGDVVGFHPLSACAPGVSCQMYATESISDPFDVLYTAGSSAHLVVLPPVETLE
jgi:hypothetical protein